MKKATWITVGLAALLPMSGLASITINALAQDNAVAYLYNGGGTFGSTGFSGGSVVIDNSSIPGPPFQQWSIAMQYKPGDTGWYSAVAYGYSGIQEINGTTVFEAEAITGEINQRTLGGTSASVKLTANGDLTTYNDSAGAGVYQLNAELGLYRTVKTVAEYNGTSKISRGWNDGSLSAGYGYTTSLFDAGTGLISLTITNTVGSYVSDFVGFDLGGGDFQLYFQQLDAKDTFDSGTVVDDGQDVVFNVSGLGDGNYEDMTSYYVLMNAAYMEDAAGNYSEAYDGGMTLTNPDYYVIPEPAALMLILGGGGALFAIRRVFMI